uniref:Uncharacterized protein n=1 Tax=Trypanosoma vivax (strain Y486) TaxID=1055687 RepID=G0TWI2_TRYVY|nr:hypothetical protein TVY486_0601110 [Trypanosoma vivax Y486]
MATGTRALTSRVFARLLPLLLASTPPRQTALDASCALICEAVIIITITTGVLILKHPHVCLFPSLYFTFLFLSLCVALGLHRWCVTVTWHVDALLVTELPPAEGISGNGGKHKES